MGFWGVCVGGCFLLNMQNQIRNLKESRCVVLGGRWVPESPLLVSASGGGGEEKSELYFRGK